MSALQNIICPCCGKVHDGTACDTTDRGAHCAVGGGSVLDSIPRADLIAMLKEAVGCYFGNGLDREGYSLDVTPECAARDINYRNAPVYPTPAEAIIGYWQKHYSPNTSIGHTVDDKKS